jgi:hypothetical protein
MKAQYCESPRLWNNLNHKDGMKRVSSESGMLQEEESLEQTGRRLCPCNEAV